MPKHVWVTTAALCSQVLEEKDDSISLIKLADKFSLVVNQLNQGNLPSFIVPMFIAFRGDAPGTYKFTIAVESAGEKFDYPGEAEVEIKGPERGHNIRISLTIPAPVEGMYWIGVYLDKELCVRVPVQVAYLKLPEPDAQRKQ